MNALKFSTLHGLLIFTQLCRADPLDTWTLSNPLPTSLPPWAIVYAIGQFVAVGGTNILTSIDGVKWIQRQSANLFCPNNEVGIAYGHGQYVAIGWDA
jgi:hypothetical protein